MSKGHMQRGEDQVLQGLVHQGGGTGGLGTSDLLLEVCATVLQRVGVGQWGSRDGGACGGDGEQRVYSRAILGGRIDRT